MHHDGRGVGVGEQVVQLFGHIAVVHVERGDTRLERPQHGLEVLVTVVQVDAHMVLAALVAGQLVAFGVATEAVGEEVIGQPPGALGDLAPSEAAVAKDEAGIIRAESGYCLVNFGYRELCRHAGPT